MLHISHTKISKISYLLAASVDGKTILHFSC